MGKKQNFKRPDDLANDSLSTNNNNRKDNRTAGDAAPENHNFFEENGNNIRKFSNLSSSEIAELLNKLEAYVKSIAATITNGQVRVIYELVYQTTNVQELQLIRPKIAFVAIKQERGSGSKAIIEKILHLISLTTTDDEHECVKNFITSFLHYHKFYNPNNN